MQRYSALISILLLLFVSVGTKAQSIYSVNFGESTCVATSKTNIQSGVYPANAGDKTRSSAMIEMKKGYVSGICVMYNDGEEVKASIFNEFGISAIDFTYSLKKDKVKLLSVIKMLDKWYIRKLLKSDLRKLIHALQEGKTEYSNEKYKIDYKFSELKDDTEE